MYEGKLNIFKYSNQRDCQRLDEVPLSQHTLFHPLKPPALNHSRRGFVTAILIYIFGTHTKIIITLSHQNG